MLPTSIFLLSAPNLNQEQLYLATQQCPNWALSLFTCSLAVCAQPFRAPGGIPSMYLQRYPFVGHLLMAYKALRACLPPTLDPPSTPCHSLSGFRSYLFPLCSLHSSHSGLFPVPLCTKHALALSLCNDYYSLCLIHSFQITAWHTPLLPAISTQMWKPSLKTLFKISTTSCQQSCALDPVYSFPLWYTAISNTPFNSLIHYVDCLLPTFHHWNSSPMKTRIFVSFVHSCSTNTHGAQKCVENWMNGESGQEPVYRTCERQKSQDIKHKEKLTYVQLWL